MKNQKLEWNELWNAMDKSPDSWIETTEEMYWQMLEVLPPTKMIGRNFLVGEPLRSNSDGEFVFSCFTTFGDTYKARNITVKQFISFFG